MPLSLRRTKIYRAAQMLGKGRRIMRVKEKLKALRNEMATKKIHAYWIPNTDAHQNEYVPDFWQRRSWLTGFTGSAGDAIITSKHGGLWTDGRYFLQAHEELRGSSIKLYKMGLPGVPTRIEFLEGELAPGKNLGFDPRLTPISLYKTFRTVAKKNRCQTGLDGSEFGGQDLG